MNNDIDKQNLLHDLDVVGNEDRKIGFDKNSFLQKMSKDGVKIFKESSIDSPEFNLNSNCFLLDLLSKHKKQQIQLEIIISMVQKNLRSKNKKKISKRKKQILMLKKMKYIINTRSRSTEVLILMISSKKEKPQIPKY